MLTPEFYQFFKRVSMMDGIRVIGSFDSYRYTQLITMATTYYLGFNTYLPYQHELTPLLMQLSNTNKQGEGLKYVMKSLNPNQRELVQLLARILVKNKLPEVAMH
jgi:hypothetical protein